MTELFFYHLEQQRLEQVLPVLLTKTLERGWRAVVECASKERSEALDAHLWTYMDDSFLPHGVAGGAQDAEQPVLLTTDSDNANQAQVRFFVDRARPGSQHADYERLVYIFDGRDPEAVDAARADWTALKGEFETTYWQQNDRGVWEKKA